MKICKENTNLFKIRQKYRSLYVENRVCCILLTVTCGATVHRQHCCVFMAVLSIFILLLTNIHMSKIQRISMVTIVMQMHHSVTLYIHHHHQLALQPGGALASATICLQVSQSLALSLHSFIPIFLRSMDTSSSHLILGLPLRLVAHSFPYSIFFGIAVSCILSICPSPLILWHLTFQFPPQRQHTAPQIQRSTIQ